MTQFIGVIMRIQFYILLIVFAMSFSSCGGTEEQSGNSTSNTSVQSTPASTPEPSRPRELASDISTPTPVATVEAVTLKPLIDTFCKARRENDEAALRRLYSAATVRSLLAYAKKDGKTSISAYLASEPVGNKCSVVNERIVGNTGEATVITETYPNGVRWTFIKENNEWKITEESSDFTNVKKGK